MELRPLYVAEPPAAYRLRLPLVVDCSLLVSIHFNEEQRPMAQERLAGHALHAPALLDHELANAALMKVRRGCPAEEALQALQRYRLQDIQRHETDALGQFELGRRYGLTAYDAAYLWLATQLRAPLATFDRRLAEAAQQHLQSL